MPIHHNLKYICLVCILFSRALPAAETILDASSFGLKADSIADDGPAITKMVAAARKNKGPVTIKFPAGQNIYVRTCPGRYIFNLNKISDITIDGGQSTFLLDPYIRFLNLVESSDITIKNLKVNFTPLPFTDGKVIAKSKNDNTITIDLFDKNRKGIFGGPTKQDGEQAYFAMLWNPGSYSTISRHCWVADVKPGQKPETVILTPQDNFKSYSEIKPGKTEISLPVPGIAHRYGPGACFNIHRNSNINIENVELWSAPWFGFHVFCNTGPVTFKKVNIRPKPNTDRLMSIWRDGFHVKGNRGKLLWENCTIIGCNDDAFNISTHCREVHEIISPTKIVLRQRYPLGPIPWHTGEKMIAADPETKSFRGSAVITSIQSEPRMLGDRPAAPILTVGLNRPIEGLKVGDTLWQPASANPDTTLRNCSIEKSCRFQSPVTLDNCTVKALLWFYSERIEGPWPSNVTVKNCSLYRGRGNPRTAVNFAGEIMGSDPINFLPRAIQYIRIINNEIYGDFSIRGAQNVILQGNRFKEKGANISIKDNINLKSSGNIDPDGKRF